MIEKLYIGLKFDGLAQVFVLTCAGMVYRLSACSHLRQHSPGGFNWGYSGSGPAQLSLALCVDAIGVEGASPRLYQAYKRQVVAKLPEVLWVLTDEQVRQTLAEIAPTLEHDDWINLDTPAGPG